MYNPTKTKWQELKDKIQSEAPRYNLNNSTSSNQSKTKSPPKTKTSTKNAKNISLCTPPFYDGMPKGNQNPSSKGGGNEELRNRAKSTCKPLISSKMSTKTCPWAPWMVKTWSNVRQMSESSEVVDGGTSVAAAAPEVSPTPVEEGGGGTLLEDAPRETEGSALKWVALWRRKVAPRGPTT